MVAMEMGRGPPEQEVSGSVRVGWHLSLDTFPHLGSVTRARKGPGG